MTASALYEGWVRHRRVEPVEHSFRYRMFMTYLDLGELPEVLDPLRGWSARRPALARYKRSDHIGEPTLALDQVIRDKVADEIGERPSGPVRMLTNLRYFGHCFNPVTFFYCFDENAKQVKAVLAQVNNTPWGESHSYVIETGGDRVIKASFRKDFHVSPLMGMDHVYEWHTTVPDDDVQVHIESRKDGERAFDATLSLGRLELNPANARRMLARYPAMTAQVVAKIYWQALRLKLKGAPYHPHPERS